VTAFPSPSCSPCSRETTTFELIMTPFFQSGRYSRISRNLEILGLGFCSIFHSVENPFEINRISNEFSWKYLQFLFKDLTFNAYHTFLQRFFVGSLEILSNFIDDSWVSFRVSPDLCFCVNPFQKLQNSQDFCGLLLNFSRFRSKAKGHIFNLSSSHCNLYLCWITRWLSLMFVINISSLSYVMKLENTHF